SSDVCSSDLEESSKEHKYSDRNTDGGTLRASLRRNSPSSRCTRVQGTSMRYQPPSGPASHACQYHPRWPPGVEVATIRPPTVAVIGRTAAYAGSGIHAASSSTSRSMEW